MTWHSPTSFGDPMPIPQGFDPAAEATKVLEDAISKLDTGYPGVQIPTLVTKGHTAQMLVESSESADLLVVGSRGHGKMADMPLGSVSDHCVAHSHCPVLVSRH